jgi:hypothetical protein
MAKINVTFDTVSKEISVDMGGTSISSELADYVTFQKTTDYDNGGKKWCCCINLSARNKEDGVSAYTTICAAQKDAGLEDVTITEGQPQTHRTIASLYAGAKNNGRGSATN